MAESIIKTIEPDTGWIVLKSSYPLVRYRKIGKIVYIHVKYDANVSGSIVFGTLPLSYTPNQLITVRNYAGNAFIKVNINGEIVCNDGDNKWINTMIVYPVD